MRMSPWGRSGGVDSRLGSFSKRRWKNKPPVPDSPTTVLSAESSTESSSTTSSDSEMVARIRGTPAPACSFEAINSNTWTVSTDRRSDLQVEVNDVTFHLHKLPILSRSALLSRLADKFGDSEMACISLGSIAGGAEAFALAAKLCYGIDLELSPSNVAGLRCAAEYLEMTEELEEGNVISKSEAYLSSVVLTSWQESFTVLQSCEHLVPEAEELRIVQRCSESIACKACLEPHKVRWSSARSAVSFKPAVTENWWYEDVTSLSLYCFEKVVTAMQMNLMSAVLIGGALELYAQKWLPGVLKCTPENTPKDSPRLSASRPSSPAGDSSPVHEFPSPTRGSPVHVKDSNAPESAARLHDVIAEQNRNRFVIEKIVCMLPQLKDSVQCSFLLRMLRAANMFNCSAECRMELETKAGHQLDQASLSDLLIPSFCHTSEYLYDVDLVRRLLEQFLVQEQGLGSGLKNKFFNRRIFGNLFLSASSKQQMQAVAPSARSKLVARLMDAYLAEVARDSKLPLTKFLLLAEAVPVAMRVSDDGLYRAIDTYLKIHSSMGEHEKKKLCRILDCQRFSIAACMHAAQNERLPLRIVVQVLFGEQLKLREAITGIRQSIEEDHGAVQTGQPRHDDSVDSIGSQQAMLETTNQMEIRALQHELSTMRHMYSELERNHTAMMKMIEKLSTTRPRRNSGSAWTPWKKPSKGDRCQKFPIKADHDSSSSGSRARTTNNQRWRNSIS